MRKITITLLAALFAGTSFTGIALTQATHPGMAAVARADDDENDNDGGEREHGHGNPHSCINPAGHMRGWCKHNGGNNGRNRGNYVTISGTVLAVNGDIAQFREDNGATITINQSQLLQAGQPLSPGAHYTLQGYFNNNMFVAQTNGGYYNNGYPGNGYPNSGANASVHGVVTSISGNRITIMQGLFSSITIDDQQALNNGTAQNLYPGRSITAYGYWSGGTFYATSIG